MSGRRLVFLHGFTQSHHHWHECAHMIGEHLGDQPTLAFVDLPGHGLSANDRLSVEQAAAELVALAGPATYIGYSMGARHALAAACAGAPEIEQLVLIGGTPGIADATERAARVADDEARASRIEEIGSERFVDEWLSQPMFGGLPAAADDRARRIRNSPEGMAASLRLAGTGAQHPLWDELGGVAVPTLVLAGAADAKFTDIGRQMAEQIASATFATIPGAGHSAHAEQPSATARLIGDWLAAQPSDRPIVSSAP
jgi:2-succinyl-6-hydroxy-2,4-cyclohexadiene-1-carboxylate synthase